MYTCIRIVMYTQIKNGILYDIENKWTVINRNGISNSQKDTHDSIT